MEEMNRQKDYDEIRQNFIRFIKAWEKGNVGELDYCMVADLFAEFSIFGPTNLSRETLKKQLAAYTEFPGYARFEILNFVCLIEGNKAQQSAGITGIFTRKDGTSRYWFSGIFTVTHKKTMFGWRITHIHFDLLNDNTVSMTRDGQGHLELIPSEREFPYVKNWIPINDRTGWFKGAPLPMVSGEYDAPWYVIRNRENIGGDAEQIQELFYCYCFAVDTNTFQLFDRIFDSDAVTDFPLFGCMDKRRTTDTMKMIREEVSRRTHHMGYFKKLEIRDACAEALICRVISGEHYAGNGTNELVENAVRYFHMQADKKDGLWYITKLGSALCPEKC